MKPLVPLRRALADPELLGGALVTPRSWNPWASRDTWAAWRILLIAMRGERLLPDELQIFQALTGGRPAPGIPPREVAIVAGRRAGKDRAISVWASYTAALCDWSDCLSKGEVGQLVIVAPSTDQASIQLDYIRGVLSASPRLASMVEHEDSDSISLTNGIRVVVRAASARRLRGATCVGIVASESAFWLSDGSGSANPDREIFRSLRPALATTQGQLITISSPYGREGVLFDLYSRHFGKESNTLIIQAETRTLNPTIPADEVERAYEDDPASARSEFGAQFRDDIADFISRAAVLACVSSGSLERGPGWSSSYRCFVDPSGGSADSMTLAIAHVDDESGLIMVDAIREIAPPFSPDAVVDEFSQLCRMYKIREITGDRYGGAWVREAFQKHGISYQHSDLTASQLYLEALPAINGKRVRLLDHPRMINQLATLVRRTGSTGKDSVSHRPGAHDDVANAVCGAISLCALSASRGEVSVGYLAPPYAVSHGSSRFPGNALSPDGGRNHCIPTGIHAEIERDSRCWGAVKGSY